MKAQYTGNDFIIEKDSMEGEDSILGEDSIKGRLYLVDFENTNNRVFEVLSGENINFLNDEIVIFFSDRVNQINLSYANKYIEQGIISFIEGKNGRDNALDFLLIYHLGKYIAQGEFLEYIVISNDKDYDSTLNFLENKDSQNITYKRLGVNTSINQTNSLNKNKRLKTDHKDLDYQKLFEESKYPVKSSKTIKDVVSMSIEETTNQTDFEHSLRSCLSRYFMKSGYGSKTSKNNKKKIRKKYNDLLINLIYKQMPY